MSDSLTRRISLSRLREKLLPMIHEARDQEVLTHLLTYACGSDAEAQISLLISRLAKVEQDHKIQQTIDYEDYTIELNRIRAGIRASLEHLPAEGPWAESQPENPLIPPPEPPSASVRKTVLASAGLLAAVILGVWWWNSRPEPAPPQPGPAATAATLPEMVLIRGGTFVMGRKDGPEDEQPAHQETVADFFLGKTEVTVAQYRYFCTQTGHAMPPAPSWGWRDTDPVVNVSWRDAEAFCRWMAKETGKPVRLPSEAEWEYAAIGSMVTRLKLSHNFPRYAGGDNPDALAWYSQNSNGAPHPVGTRSGTEDGIFDLSGNVFEWTSSFYLRYTSFSGARLAIPGHNDERVGKGGGWNSNPDKLTRTARNAANPDYLDDQLGFRVAQSIRPTS